MDNPDVARPLKNVSGGRGGCLLGVGGLSQHQELPGGIRTLPGLTEVPSRLEDYLVGVQASLVLLSKVYKL